MNRLGSSGSGSRIGYIWYLEEVNVAYETLDVDRTGGTFFSVSIGDVS